MLFHFLFINCFFIFFFFFFNDTATTEIYTLSLHDALPISLAVDLPPATGAGTDFEAAPLTIGATGAAAGLVVLPAMTLGAFAACPFATGLTSVRCGLALGSGLTDLVLATGFFVAGFLCARDLGDAFFQAGRADAFPTRFLARDELFAFRFVAAFERAGVLRAGRAGLLAMVILGGWDIECP